jgi:hypothetical protein
LYTIKYGTRIKTIPKNVQLVPEKYRSIFVGNKIAEKNTAIDGEIRRLPALIENKGKNPIFRHIKSNNSGTAKVKIIKKERDPPLFTSKQLITF